MEKQTDPQDNRHPRGEYSPLGFILCPTRELANQIQDHLISLAANISPSIRIESLSSSVLPTSLREPSGKPIDIIVATPGRALSYLHQRSKFLTHNNKNPSKNENFSEQGLDLSWTKWFILDECDRLLSLGFFPDIKEILLYMPRPRKKVSVVTGSSKRTQEEKEGRKIITNTEDRMKVLLFTATLVPEINELIKRIAPQHSTVNLNTSLTPAKNVDDVVHLVSNRRKYSLLKYYLKRKGSIKYEQVLVFCRTQQRVDRLVEALNNDNFTADGLFKDMSHKKRSETLEKFRNNQIQVLVATDILGRGIDIEGLPFVINYDIPVNPADYVHRVGRTGRADKKGVAISFVGSTPMMLNFGGRYVEHNEQHILQKIRTFTGDSLHFRKVPGPWDDNPRDAMIQYEEFEAQNFNDKRHKEIMKLLHSKEEKVLGKGMLERLQARSEARMKNPTRARYLPETELTKGLSLRHFRHGRYEDMLVDFDLSHAKNRGVIVPEKYKELVHSKKGKKKTNNRITSPFPFKKSEKTAEPFKIGNR